MKEQEEWAKATVIMWKEIPGCGGKYLASSRGVIKSLMNKTPRILTQFTHKEGYKEVKMLGGTKKVHRLIALAFLPNPDNLPCINHIDGDNSNNHLSNLEWCTVAHNNKHSFKVGSRSNRGTKNPRHIFSENQVLAIREMYKKYPLVSISLMARAMGIKKSTMRDIVKRIKWKYL